jgi:predicted DNA-binding transcriptional regulator YafY
MRRADRLFRIVQRLRRRGGGAVVTAAALAQELEVSERTIYRDVADLQASGVPVEGAAGIGYRMSRGDFDLPPLMFTDDEIEALVLGARVVKGWGDPVLAGAAEDLLAKVEAVFAVNLRDQSVVAAKLTQLRGAVRQRRKVQIDYVDRGAEESSRTIWPLGLFYWGSTWTVGGWCELRDGFRNFRLDRIAQTRVLETRYQPTAGRTLQDLFEFYRENALK